MARERGVETGGNKNLYAIDEEDSEHVEEANDSEEDLQAWCLLEESENVQWQEVVNKRKTEDEKANEASLLIVDRQSQLDIK